MRIPALLAAALALAAPLAAGSGAVPVNPILNGGFELYNAQPVFGSGGFADGAVWWSEGFGSNAQFGDHDGDGDREAILPPTGAGMHNLWQSQLPPLQAVSANFAYFEFTVESGAISPHATNQIGFALTPAHAQHPFAGIFWEGAVMFRASDMVPGGSGRVAMDPVLQGEIICPDWQPCRDFKAAYDAAPTVEAKRALLGQARIIQVSFWQFNQGVAQAVVLDDVAIIGATTVAEEAAAGNVQVNPCCGV